MQVNLYEILDQIEIRAGMYLGPNHNFKSLHSFVTGFATAASSKQLQAEKYPDFNLFSIWLLGHLKRNFGLSAGWYWQIHNRNPTDDDRAFKEFFQFLREFKKTKLKRKELTLDDESIEFNRKNAKRFRLVDGKQIRVRTKPVKIILTSFSNSATLILDYVDKNGKKVDGGWEIGTAETREALSRSFGKISGRWKKVE